MRVNWERPFGVSIFCLSIFLGIGGCGYGFQNTRNPLYIKEGVQTVYVSPITNGSFKPGIENIVYSQLVRSIAAHGKVTLVQRPEDADAVLTGAVGNASYGGKAGTAVVNLTPIGIGGGLPTAGFNIWTVYTASLSCSFSLGRTPRVKDKPAKVIWTSGFARSKDFPGSNQLDVPGTTSVLINESEFDRALGELARTMMDDVHESMLAGF